MRKFKIILCVSMVALVALGTMTVGALAMNNRLWFQTEEVTDAYVFPVTPEKAPEKWREFQTHAEMTEACQVPEEVLKAMSTKGLVETCLNYPLFGDFMAFSTPVQGASTVCSRFNGFQELSSRPDAGFELKAIYEKISLKEVVSSDEFSAMRLRFLEYVLAQDGYLDKLDAESRDVLLEKCKAIILEKYNDYRDVFRVDSTLYLAAKVLSKDNKAFIDLSAENEAIELFLKTGELRDISTELVGQVLDILNVERS